MLKIGFVPLDDRPCTKDFPNRIARIAQTEVELPPVEALGHFLTPGQPRLIEAWLLEVVPDLDYLIVSIDMLTYGGLIGSRTPRVTKDEAFQHLAVLKKLKERNPRVQFYAWNVLMRISITVHDNLTAKYWEQMNRFSVLWAQAQEGTLSEHEQALFTNLQKEIPTIIQDTYFQARERNHQVNHHAIELVEAGIIDTLILCQEDAHPIGPHKLEQRRLLDKIHPTHLNQKIFLHPGADESGLNLLARAFCDYYQQKPTIALEFYPEQARSSVPIFEDVPLGESVVSHSLASGLNVDQGQGTLWGAVYGPSDTAQGLEVWQQKEDQPLSEATLKELWDATTDHRRRGIYPILFDVRTPNGSHPPLLGFLQGKDTSLLASYAGWNTAGNTIGTALAHGIIYALAKSTGHLDEMAQKEFMVERILDDYAYQKIVRDELGELILQNPQWGTRHQLNTEGWESLNTLVQERLQSWADDYLEKYNLPPVTVQASLPWPRIFEVKIQVRLREELNA